MQQMFYHSDHIKVETLDGFKHPSMHIAHTNLPLTQNDVTKRNCGNC